MGHLDVLIEIGHDLITFSAIWIRNVGTPSTVPVRVTVLATRDLTRFARSRSHGVNDGEDLETCLFRRCSARRLSTESLDD